MDTILETYNPPEVSISKVYYLIFLVQCVLQCIVYAAAYKLWKSTRITCKENRELLVYKNCGNTQVIDRVASKMWQIGSFLFCNEGRRCSSR